MNVLMLDEKRVMVDAYETSIQKMFENLGEEDGVFSAGALVRDDETCFDHLSLSLFCRH